MTPGQKEMIGQLMRQYAPLMVQLTFRRTGDPQLSEELVQETFLTACKKADIVCSHEKPLAWLYQTLQYLTMKEINRACHSREESSEEIQDIAAADDPPAFHEILPRTLTTEERRILILRFEHRLSHREIAEALGISEVACRKQVSRALQKCRISIKRE